MKDEQPVGSLYGRNLNRVEYEEGGKAKPTWGELHEALTNVMLELSHYVSEHGFTSNLHPFMARANDVLNRCVQRVGEAKPEAPAPPSKFRPIGPDPVTGVRLVERIEEAPAPQFVCDSQSCGKAGHPCNYPPVGTGQPPGDAQNQGGGEDLYQAYLLGCEDDCIPEPKTFEQFMTMWNGGNMSDREPEAIPASGNNGSVCPECKGSGVVVGRSQPDIQRMVERFLSWKLPEDFNPDGGISFKREFNENTPFPMRHESTGTNLLDATQAKAMLEYVLGEAKPEAPAPTPVTPGTIDREGFNETQQVQQEGPAVAEGNGLLDGRQRNSVGKTGMWTCSNAENGHLRADLGSAHFKDDDELLIAAKGVLENDCQYWRERLRAEVAKRGKL